MKNLLIITILFCLFSTDGMGQLKAQKSNYSLRQTELKSNILSANQRSPTIDFMARKPTDSSVGFLIVGGAVLTIVPPLVSDRTGAYILSGLGVTMVLAGLVVLDNNLAD